MGIHLWGSVFECVCVCSHCIVYSFISTRSCLRMSAFEQERTHLVQRITNGLVECGETAGEINANLEALNKTAESVVAMANVWNQFQASLRALSAAQAPAMVPYE